MRRLPSVAAAAGWSLRAWRAITIAVFRRISSPSTEPYPLMGHDDAVVWTGDSFVDAAMIGEVKERFGMTSGLFDMESTAVCQAAELFGDLPVVVVKMVSDVPEEGDNECSYDEFVDSHSDFGAIIDYLENLK